MTVDCDCDGGCREDGICPDCLGVGWYIDNSRAARVYAWLRQWADDEVWKEAN